VRRRLGPQILEFLRCGVATEYLVAVRVAPKARYDVAGCPGLADDEFGHRPQVGRSAGCFLVGMADATLVEGEILGVAQRQPEKVRPTGVSSRSIPKSMPSRANRRAFSSCE
jgi:hypothetical protein